MLKGTMFITEDMEIVMNTPINALSQIISLDEDGIFDDEKDMIVGGTCLLPPIESKIAEADGDEQAYDNFYHMHLDKPFQKQFIAALLLFLMKGGDILLFLPELGDTYTAQKLSQHLYISYGIHPGIIGATNPELANWYFDERCIPLWLNMVYMDNLITPNQYLYQYPLDASITADKNVLNKLIYDINPYGNTINDKINYLVDFHKKIHQNPNVQSAIESIY